MLRNAACPTPACPAMSSQQDSPNRATMRSRTARLTRPYIWMMSRAPRPGALARRALELTSIAGPVASPLRRATPPRWETHGGARAAAGPPRAAAAWGRLGVPRSGPPADLRQFKGRAGLGGSEAIIQGLGAPGLPGRSRGQPARPCAGRIGTRCRFERAQLLQSTPMSGDVPAL